MPSQFSPKTDRPMTIGLFLNDMNDPNGNNLWRGVASTLLENNCNLVCFAGGSPKNPDEDDEQRTILYDLADASILDGLLVWSGAINAYLDPAEVHSFFEKFSSLPILSIAMQVEGVTSVLPDNYQGMCDAVTHLVQAHDRRRIVFIKGTENHQESNIRYNAYKDTLAYNHIDFDPQLVLPGGFDARVGEAAVRHLVENKIEFDAIVTNDDAVAIGALQTLRQYHFDLPRQVSVIGFDDQTIAQSLEIPLTTVRIPNFDLGRYVAQLMLKMINDEGSLLSETIPLQLLVRESCGCPSPTVQQARLSPYIPQREAYPDSLLKRREDILVELHLAAGSIPGSESRIAALFDAFMEDMVVVQADSPQAFLHELEHFSRNWAEVHKDVMVLQNVITTMRKAILPLLANHPHAGIAAENLWQQARVLIAECSHRIDMRQQIVNQMTVLTLHTVNQALTTAQDFDRLADVVVNALPMLGFEGVYLSLYEDSSNPAGWSRLTIACEKGQRLALSEEGIRFRSPQLFPDDFHKQDGNQNWVVMPLHVHRERIGFLMLKAGPLDGMIYEGIRLQVSSALKGIALQKELMDLSLTDSLTEIGNRRSFEMFLIKEAERNFRYHNGLSLVMVDLDIFKDYNDTFGHPAGDAALIEVARIISSCARRGLDVVVRYGGDEFAALLTETSLEAAAILAENIREKVENSPVLLKKMTVSVGVTCLGPDENDGRILIERCDRALYQSKRNGRNRVTVLDCQ